MNRGRYHPKDQVAATAGGYEEVALLIRESEDFASPVHAVHRRHDRDEQRLAEDFARRQAAGVGPSVEEGVVTALADMSRPTKERDAARHISPCRPALAPGVARVYPAPLGWGSDLVLMDH